MRYNKISTEQTPLCGVVIYTRIRSKTTVLRSVVITICAIWHSSSHKKCRKILIDSMVDITKVWFSNIAISQNALCFRSKQFVWSLWIPINIEIILYNSKPQALRADTVLYNRIITMKTYWCFGCSYTSKYDYHIRPISFQSITKT